jgi:hypothetical protein
MTERTHRAIVIDPERRTITEVQLPDTLAAIRALIPRADDEGLDRFMLADHGESWDEGWVRDCGLANGEPVHAIKFLGWHDPHAGIVVIVGVDKETRQTCDARFPLTTLLGVVDWLGLIKADVTWVEEEDGSRAVITYERVVA